MDARARRFCAVAALRRAAHELAPGQTSLADQLQVALEQMVHLRHPQLSDCLENLNDDGDHATVLRLFDEFLASEVASRARTPKFSSFQAGVPVSASSI